MDGQTVETVAKQFPWTSWAVWDEEFPDGDCVEKRPSELVNFVHRHAEDLKPDVVLLGLNRSDDLAAPFENFHAPTRKHYDYRLKTVIQDGGLDRLQGAFMTDLVNEVGPDSYGVEVTDDDAAVMLEQLNLLGQGAYHVICFGNKSFDGLVDYFDVGVTSRSPELKIATVRADGLTLHLYRIWFYGLYGANQDKVDVFECQLQVLNEEIS